MCRSGHGGTLQRQTNLSIDRESNSKCNFIHFVLLSAGVLGSMDTALGFCNIEAENRIYIRAIFRQNGKYHTILLPNIYYTYIHTWYNIHLIYYLYVCVYTHMYIFDTMYT